ncbi:MAG: VanW protein [Bacilli bacterium]|nr:VanW protein [Bacilli bacterium]
MHRYVAYFFLTLLVFSVVICVTIFAYGSQKTLPYGVTISGWQVQGLTLAQFDLQLKNTMTKFGAQQVYFTCESKGCEPKTKQSSPSTWQSASITLHDLGLFTNEKEIVARIHSIQRGSWFQKSWSRWQLKNTKLTLTLSFEPSVLLKTINHVWPSASQFQPVNAARLITKEDTLSIIPEINAYRLDKQLLQKRLILSTHAASSQWLHKIQLEFQQNKPLSMTVSLPLIVEQPAITSQSLEAQGISRKISQFTTSLNTSAVGRTHNVTATARILQNQLLAPGDIFDYSQIIRQTEKSFGFQEAPVILNGKLVPGIGGGICQVSSTLYNAVLRAGLQIIERRNHSLPVSYVPLGQDATFATDQINFRFRNSSAHFILIQAVVAENELTVKLFGTIPQQTSYVITSQVVQKLQPSIRYLFNPELSRNAYQTLQLGKQGYIVETYRAKIENGAAFSKQLISRDTYPPQPTLVAVGKARTDQAKPLNPPLLEDGVSGPVY